MEQIHDKLNNKYHWYNHWHQVRGFEVIHWAVLIVITVSLGYFVHQKGMTSLAAINKGDSSPAPLSVLGNKTLAVIVFNKSTDNPIKISNVQKYFFDDQFSVANYFNVVSLGKMSMLRAGAGVYVKPFVNGSNTCSNLANWTTNGHSGISADYYVYMFPRIQGTGCPNGAAWPTSSGSNQVWLNGEGYGADLTSDTGVVARSYAIHILLYTFGLRSAAVCDKYISNGNCFSAIAPGDIIRTYDIMDAYNHALYDIYGYAAAYHTNAYHKEQLGWLGNITNATQNGQYTIGALNAPSGLPQALKIPIVGTNKSFYVEYRAQAPPFDDFIGGYVPLKDKITTGVLINIAPVSAPSIGNSDTLLVRGTWGAWQVGEVFISGNIVITSCNVGSSSATIQVRFDGSNVPCNIPPPTPCQIAPPEFSVNPVEGTNSPGSVIKYKVSILNKDSSSCPATTFKINSTLPGQDWIQKPASRGELLAPGGSITMKFKVRSPADATGTNTIRYILTSDAGHTASKDVTYLIGNTPFVISSVTQSDEFPLPFVTVDNLVAEQPGNRFLIGANTWHTIDWSLQSNHVGNESCTLQPSEQTGNSGSYPFYAQNTMKYDLRCISGTSTATDFVVAQIQNTPPPSTCIHTSPTVSLSPVNQSAVLNTFVYYDISMTNNDDPVSCAGQVSTFHITPQLPAGWGSDTMGFDINIQPGYNKVRTVAVLRSISSGSDSFSYRLDNTTYPLAPSGIGSASLLVTQALPTFPNCNSGSSSGFNFTICLSSTGVSAEVNNLGQNYIVIKMDGKIIESCDVGETSCPFSGHFPVSLVPGSSHSVTAQVKNITLGLVTSYNAQLIAN